MTMEKKNKNEGKKNHIFSCCMTKDLNDKLTEYCNEKTTSKACVIRQAVKEKLQREGEL